MNLSRHQNRCFRASVRAIFVVRLHFFSTYTILYELFPLLIPAYYQDITMMMMFNAKERSLDEFKVLG
jgi:hypothetical protein